MELIAGDLPLPRGFPYQLLQYTRRFLFNKTEETNQKLEYLVIHKKTCWTEHWQAFVSNIVQCLMGRDSGIQVTWTH